MSEYRRRRPESNSTPIPQEQPQSEYAQPRYEQPRYEQPRPQPQNMVVNQISINNEQGFGSESYFDGGLLQLIGYGLLAAIIIAFTLGLGYPFAACMLYRWEAKHTVINGRRLRFDGTAMQLLGNWIIWFLLTLITLGIYGLWLNIKLKQWRTKHTHFA